MKPEIKSPLIRDASPEARDAVRRAARAAFQDFYVKDPWLVLDPATGGNAWLVCVAPDSRYIGANPLLFAAVAAGNEGYLNDGVGFFFVGPHPFEMVRGKTRPATQIP